MFAQRLTVFCGNIHKSQPDILYLKMIIGFNSREKDNRLAKTFVVAATGMTGCSLVE
jgi:hypothetical protein